MTRLVDVGTVAWVVDEHCPLLLIIGVSILFRAFETVGRPCYERQVYIPDDFFFAFR